MMAERKAMAKAEMIFLTTGVMAKRANTTIWQVYRVISHLDIKPIGYAGRFPVFTHVDALRVVVEIRRRQILQTTRVTWKERILKHLEKGPCSTLGMRRVFQAKGNTLPMQICYLHKAGKIRRGAHGEWMLAEDTDG